METPKCPVCGTALRLELQKTVIAHPSEVDCPHAGRSWRVHKRNENDKRLTFSEFAAKVKSQGGGQAPSSAPIPATPAPAPMPAPGPQVPGVK